MNWVAAIIAFFRSVTGVARVVEKGLPSQKIQEERFDEKKALREQDLNQHMLNDDFRYLKRRTEIDVWDYVRDVHPKFDMETLVLYHKILTARVYQFRYDNAKNPFVHRKIREWVKENPKK